MLASKQFAVELHRHSPFVPVDGTRAELCARVGHDQFGVRNETPFAFCAQGSRDQFRSLNKVRGIETFRKPSVNRGKEFPGLRVAAEHS